MAQAGIIPTNNLRGWSNRWNLGVYHTLQKHPSETNPRENPIMNHIPGNSFFLEQVHVRGSTNKSIIDVVEYLFFLLAMCNTRKFLKLIVQVSLLICFPWHWHYYPVCLPKVQKSQQRDDQKGKPRSSLWRCRSNKGMIFTPRTVNGIHFY